MAPRCEFLYVLEHANRYSDYNIMHCCGWAGAKNNIELWQDYPVKCVNWAVFVEGLPLPEGRAFFGDKAILGGFETLHLDASLGKYKGIMYSGQKKEIEDFTRDTILTFGKRGLMLGGDCTIATWLDHPDQLQASQHTVLSRVFPHFYDSDEAYATAATMVAAQMEEACDRMAAAMGEGTFRHVCFGVAALRMTDGSHLLFSNLFALLPANMTATINADREAERLWMQTDFHRHVITVTLRHPERATSLIRGIDIFLSRPTQMLDMRKAVGHTIDNEGRTTSLTFRELTQQPLLQHLDQLTFYPAMTIDIGQSGQPLLVQNADYGGIPADLSDMRRWSGGAKVALSHSGRLLLGDITAIVHNPLEIGIRYRFGHALCVHFFQYATESVIPYDRRSVRSR